MLGRTYVAYPDGRGQAHTERWRLVALDQDGCVGLEPDGMHVLVSNARLAALLKVEEELSSSRRLMEGKPGGTRHAPRGHRAS